MNRPPLAFLQRGPRDFVVGFGPFTSCATPPPGGAAFYRNDFWLSDPRPWKVPARLERHQHLPFGPAGPFVRTEVRWEKPDHSGYAGVFAEARDLLESGLLQKTVPVAVQRGLLTSTHLSSLLNRLSHLPGMLHAYGWLEGNKRFLGATPEILLRGQGRTAETMALAGTATPGEHSRLRVDPKELREHALVVAALQDRLAPLGPVRTGRRGILDLGSMLHLHTPIALGPLASSGPALPDLIPRLHPTPALGPFPRTPDALDLLRGWRDRLGCPAEFGAPFGFWDRGRLDVLVAIRMLVLHGRQVLLPTGAGLLAQSRLTSEWSELLLKAASVKDLFGLAAPSPAREIHQTGILTRSPW